MMKLLATTLLLLGSCVPNGGDLSAAAVDAARPSAIDDLAVADVADAAAVDQARPRALPDLAGSPGVQVTVTMTTRATIGCGPGLFGIGTVAAAGGGLECSGMTCSGTFTVGQEVILVATPNPDSDFTGWGGACSGADPRCQFTVTGPTALTAGFYSAALGVDVQNPGGGGFVQVYQDGTTPPVPGCGGGAGISCCYRIRPGTRMHLHAYHADNVSFDGWGLDCAGVTGLDCYLTVSTTNRASATMPRFSH